MRALTWGDIRWDGKLGHVTLQQGKGDKGRTACLTRLTCDLMQGCNGRPHDADKSLWNLSPDNLRQVLRQLGDRTGMHLEPREMRYTAARWILERRRARSACSAPLAEPRAC